MGARSPGLEGTPCVRRTEGERDDGQQTRNAKRGVRCPRAGESDAEADSSAGRPETERATGIWGGVGWGREGQRKQEVRGREAKVGGGRQRQSLLGRRSSPPRRGVARYVGP